LGGKEKSLDEETNTQLVQQAYHSIRTGDISSFLNLLAEEVLWTIPEMTNVPFSGTWQGREQVEQFFRKVAEAQDIVAFEPGEFIAQRDKVIVLGHFTMQVKATGKTSRSQWVHTWTVEENKISSLREYVDTLAVSRAHSPTNDLP
jgi:uncharacterized protein